MAFFKKMSSFFIALVVFLIPSVSALAAGPAAAPIVIVADTRHLNGLMLFWANLYNESHLQFTILTIILIPLVGVIFGLLADVVMNWIGIDLKNRDLAEH